MYLVFFITTVKWAIIIIILIFVHDNNHVAKYIVNIAHPSVRVLSVCMCECVRACMHVCPQSWG